MRISEHDIERFGTAMDPPVVYTYSKHFCQLHIHVTYLITKEPERDLPSTQQKGTYHPPNSNCHECATHLILRDLWTPQVKISFYSIKIARSEVNRCNLIIIENKDQTKKTKVENIGCYSVTLIVSYIIWSSYISVISLCKKV